MKNILITLLILVILGLIVWDICFRVKPVSPPIDYGYTTDTLYVHDTIKIPDPYPVPTPPRIIRIYITDTLKLDSLKLAIRDRDIVITGLKEEIAIHQNYLKQFPQNPKLLFVDLNRDTLALGLLQISGLSEKDSWPIDLNAFNYRWDFINGLTRQVTKPPPTDERLIVDYFVGGGVDILWASPTVSGRAEIPFRNFRLYGATEIGFLKKEASTIKVGLEYQINASRRNRIR